MRHAIFAGLLACLCVSNSGCDDGDAVDGGADGARPGDAEVMPEGDARISGPATERMVTLGADDPLPVLDPPLTAEAITAIREGFDWAEADPWPETDPDGRPALFYATILVSGHDEREVLDLAELHHWELPLFAEERARWAGQIGVFEHAGDTTSNAHFAILPGAAFNVMRTAAVEGDVGLTAVVRRDPPPGYQHPDGSLVYEKLIEAGFSYTSRGAPPEAAFYDDGPLEEPFLAEIIGLIIALSQDARDVVEDVAGDIDSEWRDTEPVTFTLVPLNTDPAFNPAGGPPTPMQRAWRAPEDDYRRGRALRLPGVELVLGVGLGHQRVRADRDGVATHRIGINAEYAVCVRGDNHAIFLSELWDPHQICDFQSGRARVQVTGPEAVTLAIRDWRINLIAQASDAWRYTRSKLGYRVRRPARVLVGTLADVFGLFNGNRAFTLCGSYDALQDAELESAILLIPEPTIQLFADRALSFDIIMPNVPAEEAAFSRGVLVHEYGHFVMCDLTHFHDPDVFGEAWLDVVNTSLFVLQNPGVEVLYIVEGFADWFTSQVVGGVNYFDPPGNLGFLTSLTYCAPEAECMEANFGGPALPSAGSFVAQLAQIATLLHDLFDGRSTTVNDVTEPGGAWCPGAPPTPAPMGGCGGPIRANDAEAIDLRPTSIIHLFQNLTFEGNTYNLRTLLRAMVRTLRDAGHDDAQICEVFALHSPTGRCADFGGADLDTSGLVPFVPTFTAVPTDPSGMARWAWRDTSAAATGFETELTRDGGAPATSPVAYAREAEWSTAVGFDEALRFRVRTLNGAQAGGWAEHRAVSLAEPVVDVEVNPAAGGLDVTWTPTVASAYRVRIVEQSPVYCADDGACADFGGRCVAGACVELRREERFEGPVEAPILALRGLSGGELVCAEVIALNQAGVASAASPERCANAPRPVALHVDGDAGDDAGTGAAGAPLQTLTAALARVGAGTTVIRLSGPTQTIPGVLTVPDGVALEGGWTHDGAAWVPGGAPSRIIVQGLGASNLRCDAPPLDGEAALAPAVESAGGALDLRRLVIVSRDVEVPDGACRAGIVAGSVRLDGVELLPVAPADQAGGCFVGVAAVGGDLDVRGSSVVGVSGSRPIEGLVAVGACAAGVDRLVVERSEIAAFGDSGASAPFAPDTLVGLSAVGVGQATIARSTLLTNDFHPTTGGTLIAARIRAEREIFVHNTVARADFKGGEQVALDLGAQGDALDRIRLIHVTAAAGRDFENRDPVEPGATAAAVRITGAVDAIEVLNAALLLAPGAPAGAGLQSVVDRRTTTDPGIQSLRGDVLSVHKLNNAIPPFFLHCPAGDEFTNIQAGVGVSVASAWACDPIGREVRARGWTVESMLGLDQVANGRVITLDRDHAIVQRAAAAHAAGVRIDGAMGAEVNADRFGRDRDPAAPGVGALRP